MAPRAPGYASVRPALIVCALVCLSLGASSAVSGANLVKVPTCAKGQHSTARKPCKTAKQVVKYVPLPVCAAGQRSSAAKPCIALKYNGPPAPTRPSPAIVAGTTRPPTTTPALATNTAPAQPLLGPHITTHLCQDRTTGTIFECQPLADPGNASLADYPALGG
jgi:hypothetical protein